MQKIQLLKRYYNVLEGDLNPFTVKDTDFRTLLVQQTEQGEKLLAYNHTYFTKEHIEHVGANTYWFKGLHDIYPLYSKQQIRRDKYPSLLTRVNNLPANRKVLSTYQYYPGQIELIMEVDIHQLTDEETRFYYYNLLFGQEYREVKDILNSTLFTLPKDGTRRRFVCNVQYLLERYINIIDSGFNPTGSAEWHLMIDEDLTESDVFKLMKQYLEGLIYHLYIHYGEYMDLERTSYFFLRRITLKNKYKALEHIHEALYKGAVDDLLQTVIQEFLSGFEDRQVSLPLSCIYKFETLADRMHVVLRENSKRDSGYISELLSDVFLREGLNSPQFIDYMQQQHELAMKDRTGEQCIEYLKQKVKKYKGLLSSEQQAYNPNYSSALETLMAWCKDQISYYKTSEKPYSTHKFKFNGSVAELAAVIRALHETGLFFDISGYKLCQLTGRVFSTPRVDSISSQSLYNKYLSIDPGVADRIQQLFQTAINKLEELKD